MLQQCSAKFYDLERQFLKLDTLYSRTLKEKDNTLKEVENLEKEALLLDKVTGLFKHLIDVLLEAKKQEIENLVTYGLKTVFTDQDLKFHINLEYKYNSIYTTFMTELAGVAEGDVLDSFGGGIVNIESFLLRLITLFQTKLGPYLFLDESFSHLSEEYVDNCSMLLKNLCKELGVTIIAVTHQEQMLSHADKVYKAKSVDNKLLVEAV